MTLPPRHTQAGWSIASQVINSGGNLVLAILVARSTDAHGFGAWSLCFVGYAILIGAVRAALFTPMLLQASAQRRDSVVSGTHVSAVGAIGLAILPFGVAGSLLAPYDMHGTIMALSLLTPALLIQDALRFTAFARGRAGNAVTLDAIWLLAQVSMTVVLVEISPQPSAAMLTGAWGIGAAVSGVSGLVQLKVRPAVRDAVTFFSRSRAAFSLLLGEYGVTTGISQSVPFLVTWAAGLQAVAGLRGGQIMFGPVNVIVQGLMPTATLRASSRAAGLKPSFAFVLAWSAAVSGVSIATGGTLLVVPQSWGVTVLGDTWGVASPTFFALAIYSALRGPITGVQILLRARRRFLRLVLITALVDSPLLVLPFMGATESGAVGAAWGLAAAAGLGAAAALLALWFTIRSERVPGADSRGSSSTAHQRVYG
jgi:O-antigen/teichoic acid export membrane protein